MTPADHELLKRAALAAGIKLGGWLVARNAYFVQTSDSSYIFWNPLQDDGDAFRLIIALNFGVSVPLIRLVDVVSFRDSSITARMYIEGDPAEAARRAIVRAAAACVS